MSHGGSHRDVVDRGLTTTQVEGGAPSDVDATDLDGCVDDPHASAGAHERGRHPRLLHARRLEHVDRQPGGNERVVTVIAVDRPRGQASQQTAVHHVLGPWPAGARVRDERVAIRFEEARLVHDLCRR